MNPTKEFLNLRKSVLEYTNDQMNLSLDNDNQVYIALFDIPNQNLVEGMSNQTYALIFGLNTHIYFENGNYIIDLEKNKDVMQAMQSLLISSSQILKKMELTTNLEYYESNNIRLYLKTKKGIYFREIDNSCKEDKFIMMLFNNLRHNILKAYDENKKNESICKKV